jgi:hypothetical protein
MGYDATKLSKKVFLVDHSLAERLEEFRKTKGLPSDAAAIRTLLEQALEVHDSPRSLVQRVRGMLLLGESLAVAAFEGLAQHRLVETVEIKTDAVRATLRDGTHLNIAGPMDWSIEDKDGNIIEESKA